MGHRYTSCHLLRILSEQGYMLCTIRAKVNTISLCTILIGLVFVSLFNIGKAVPRGWRQGRMQDATNELYRRLCDHMNSIEQASNLSIEDFHCRFMILEDAAADMIGTVEAALIRYYTPIWNNMIDGFGNHDPGSGRYEQAVSDWDILHPGRAWAARLNGAALPLEMVEQKVQFYFADFAAKKNIELC